MKLNFDYRGTKITYHLTYRKTKAIAIKVTGDGTVNVIAPIGTSVYAVMDKVKGNAVWILSQLYRNKPKSPAIQLLEQYTYLGKNYKLEIVENLELAIPKVKMLRGKLVVETSTKSPEVNRQAIINWYNQKVSAKLKERLKAHQEMFEVVPKKVQVVDDTSILFKTDAEVITANVRVGMIPVEVIDYLLVASLCHHNLKEEKAAKSRLAEVIPTFEKSQIWLQENKNQLTL